MLNAFTEIGIDKAADNKQAFINFTRTCLLSPPPFDARFVTIEILESLPFSDEVNQALLHYEGTAGTILQAVEDLGIAQPALEDAYLQALQWAAGIMQLLLE